MLKKQPPFRSVDGFIPQSNAPRSVGFGDVKKPMPARPQPRSTDGFPAIGQTLSSYSPTQSSSASSRTTAPRATSMSPFDLSVEDKQPPKKRKNRHFPWKRVLAGFLILMLVVGGWLGYKFVYNASKTFNGNIFGILSKTKLNGEDAGRVNILLAGNSSDDKGHQGANLTDSIMVISLDTKHNTAFMMSVPRDLWVNIPDNGHAKINEAYVDGQSEKFSEQGYFPGGMGLLQKVIQDNFNINLNYYALIDYQALRDMVNAVGGIDITVKSVDPRGLYDPSIDYTTHGPLVKLTNGTHTLNGQQALDLARARGDAYGSYGFPASDFDRTNNQRKELLALKTKVSSAGSLSNPLTLSKLTDSVGKNVKTNMSLSEARRAYDIGKNVSNIQSVGLNSVNGKNLLASYASPLGQSALIPAAGIDNFSDIQQAIKQLTSNDPVVREGAKVVVLNGTNTPGLASTAAKKLTDKNIDVVGTDNATTQQAVTSIIDASDGSMSGTRSLLVSMYGNHVTTTNPYKNIFSADFIVIVGADKIPKSTTSSP